MTAPKYHFASDNTSGICPEAWAALEETNAGFLPSYGDDDTTRAACEKFRDLFETDCDVYFVFNGTAANSLALATLCQSYHSVIVGEASHVETDECGAPEFFSNGSKLLLAKHHEGKLNPTDVERLITSRTDIHFPRPRGLSLSQSTELGTVYTHAELRALTSLAHRHGLKVHMDGARFFNALASSNGSAADITWRAGIDVLCCGGTKLGMAVTEAVVFFDRALGAEFAYRCKQAGQLCSKMRFISAQWLTMLSGGTWQKHAEHGNTMARRLATGLQALPDIQILYPTDANAVFAKLPAPLNSALKERGWRFYNFIGGGSRFMCSWRVTAEDVDALLADARAALTCKPPRDSAPS
jgi:threonine aldolase